MSTEFSEICTRLESWYDSPRGRYSLQLEKRLVDRLLDTVFGYHQLEISVARNLPLSSSNQLSHKIYANQASGKGVGLVSEMAYLPFANDSIDVVVIHHALEFSPHPHALLREVHRVVAPQGRIVILGFNPLSLFGAGQRAMGMLSKRPWSSLKQLSAHRLKDWLHLLGAEVEPVQHALVTPPAGKGRMFDWLQRVDSIAMRYHLPAGGIYAISAQKKVSSLTPTRLRWRRPVRGRLIGLAVPQSVSNPNSNTRSGRTARTGWVRPVGPNSRSS